MTRMFSPITPSPQSPATSHQILCTLTLNKFKVQAGPTQYRTDLRLRAPTWLAESGQHGLEGLGAGRTHVPTASSKGPGPWSPLLPADGPCNTGPGPLALQQRPAGPRSSSAACLPGSPALGFSSRRPGPHAAPEAGLWPLGPHWQMWPRISVSSDRVGRLDAQPRRLSRLHTRPGSVCRTGAEERPRWLPSQKSHLFKVQFN